MQFEFTNVRGGPGQEFIHLCRVQFFASDNEVSPTSISCTNSQAAAAERPEKLHSPNTANRWKDKFEGRTVCVTFNFAAPVELTHYTFTTAADAPEFDPVSWKVRGLAREWVLLDEQVNAAAPAGRGAAYVKFALTMPEAPLGGLQIPWTTNQVAVNLKEVRNWRLTMPGNKKAPVSRINVCVIGRIGAGKSTFFESVVRVLYGRAMGWFHSCPSAESVTKRQQTVELSDMPVNFMDVPGYDSSVDWETWKTVFRLVIEGRVSDYDELVPVKKDVLQKIKRRPLPGFADRVHVVVLLRPASEESLQYETRIRELIDAHRDDVKFVVLLTKCDEIVGNNLKRAYEDPGILRSRQKLAAAAEIDPMHVLPIAAYGGHIGLRSMEVDLLILQALIKIQERANEAVVSELLFNQRQGCSQTRGHDE